MLKKKSLFLGLGIALVALTASLLTTHGINNVNAASSWEKTANWTKVAGGQTHSETDEGIKFSSFGGPGAYEKFNLPLCLDGLSLTIGTASTFNANDCFGFYLQGASANANLSPNNGVKFGYWKQNANRSTLVYGDKYNYSGLTAKNYKEVTKENVGFGNGFGGYTSSLVLDPATADTYFSTYSFEKAVGGNDDTDMYQVTITSTMKITDFYKSNAYNVSNDYKTVVTYIDANDIPGMGDDGMVRFYVYGHSYVGGGTIDSVEVNDLTSSNIDFASEYLASMTCDATGKTAPVTGQDYTDLVTAYSFLPEDVQNALKASVLSGDDSYGYDVLKEFGLRYRLVVTNHGSTYDFMNIADDLANLNNFSIINNNEILPMVIIASSALILGVFGYFILKNKKHLAK